jgi:replication-associated recombination protein RarA
MNTLIYGNIASGKTTLAMLLKKYYKTQKEECKVYDTNDKVESLSKEIKRQKEILERIEETKDSFTQHSIIVCCEEEPSNIYRFYDISTPDKYRPALYNYYYRCIRK